MSPVMVFMGGIGWYVLDKLAISGWLTFFVLAAIYSVLYFALAYRFMMNDYERETIMVPVGKALRKLLLLK